MTSTDWLTGVLVIITGFYAWQTRKTVQAMNEANEVNNRPVVSINLKERKESISFVDFIVTNAGKGVARDISFKVKGKNILIKEVGDRKEKIKDFRVIKHGIQVLAPGESRKYWFVSVMGRVEEFQKLDTKIEVTYYGNNKGQPYNDTFSLDFLSLPEYSLGDDPLYKLSKESEKIRNELKEINRNLKK
jgi:hypothetical protein